MNQFPQDDTQMENMLDSLTNAILMEQDLDTLLHDYPKNPELAGLVDVIRKLSLHLSGYAHRHTPSDAFMQSLRHDMADNSDSVLSRLRAVPMPLRVQIATGLAAIVAGIMFIARRRMNDSDEHMDMEEVPAI